MLCISLQVVALHTNASWQVSCFAYLRNCRLAYRLAIACWHIYIHTCWHIYIHGYLRALHIFRNSSRIAYKRQLASVFTKAPDDGQRPHQTALLLKVIQTSTVHHTSLCTEKVLEGASRGRRRCHEDAAARSVA